MGRQTRTRVASRPRRRVASRSPRATASLGSTRRHELGGRTLFRGLVTLSDLARVFAVLAAGLVFIVPAGWAVAITGSLDEGLALLFARDPVGVLVASVPGLLVSAAVGIILASVCLGLSSLPLRGGEVASLGRGRRAAVVAIALVAAVAVLLAGEVTPWAPAQVASGIALVGCALPILAVLLTRGLPERQPRLDSLSVMVSLWSLVVVLMVISWGLQPLPRVEIREGSDVTRGFLVGAGSGDVVLLMKDDSPGPRKSGTYDLTTIPLDRVEVRICDTSLYSFGENCSSTRPIDLRAFFPAE